MTRSTHPYGSDPSQLGELFLPAGARPFAVVVVVHGGYWKAQYDRSLMTDLCLDLAAHGLAAWNLEYRRVGSGGGWPATLLDVAAGVDLLADLEAPLDLSRVVAVGHSAGGQLALWAASRPTLPADAPGADPRVVIGAVVSQAGLLDLTLAAGLTPSSTPTRAFWEIRPCSMSATCLRLRANVFLSASRSSCCTETATSRSQCASRPATRQPRAIPVTRASSSCSHVPGISSTSTRTPKRGTLLATGSSLR